ncbi:MAG: hypothetical protein H7Z19_21415, partial [Chitinophagaceae bacterium]|nr:hypothetical protein [Rubrivivax sp.]
MTAPLQIACTGFDAELLLAGSQWGPFVTETRATLDELVAVEADALVIGSDDVLALAAWPAWPVTCLQSAVVVVVGAAVDLAQTVLLLQSGVQEVLPRSEADGPRLGRALRHAIERKRLDIATRRAYATDLSTGLPHHPQLLEHMT